MSMIDDATNQRESYMAEEETTEAAMLVFWSWVEKYGIPHSVYLDRLAVYVSDRAPTLEEQLEGIEPKTAFGRALEKRPMPRAREHVLVRECLDHSIHIFYKEKEMKVEEKTSTETVTQQRLVEKRGTFLTSLDRTSKAH